ncbi:pilT [Mytilus coruscus]|uniref:PilT n=1 Tax=Mytilus coruscus TaxID=42192 RepID=A0A6J8CUF4_MYTCO|nr:pilT [Mytilus coruscus]
MWKKVTKASIHLATCIKTSNTYSADIQDKIERLRTRPILAVEYTESLREIVKWINGNEETLWDDNAFGTCHDVMQSIDMAKPLDNGESRYFRIYTKIETFRQEGDRNKKSAEMFAVLVYIVLHGSSSVNEIDANVVEEISKAICHQDVSCDLLSIEKCIHGLTPKYLEQIGDHVTTRDALIIYFRLNKNDECHFAFDAYSFVFALIKRLQCNPDVVLIGKYIQTLANKLEHIEIVNLFLDVLKESEKCISGINMILFLDGVTSKGANFKRFEKQQRFYELLYRKVDDSDNTVFHIIVMHYVEYERLKLYIEYICESRPDVMQVKNKTEFSPLHFARFLGRIEIICIFMCNSNERDEKLIGELRSSVNSGIVILERLNSSKMDDDDDLNMLKKLKLGEERDYFCILDLIGNEEKETEEMDLLGNDVKETEEIDFSKLIGDSIVEVITDFKKGLKAFTKIPNIFKTINKATKL